MKEKIKTTSIYNHLYCSRDRWKLGKVDKTCQHSILETRFSLIFYPAFSLAWYIKTTSIYNHLYCSRDRWKLRKVDEACQHSTLETQFRLNPTFFLALNISFTAHFIRDRNIIHNDWRKRWVKVAKDAKNTAEEISKRNQGKYTPSIEVVKKLKAMAI